MSWSFWLPIVWLSGGTVLGLFFGHWSANIDGDPAAFVHQWQDLIGSLVGASIGALTATSIFLATEVHKSKKESKDHLHLLHRSIGAALGNLAEIDSTLHTFVDYTLRQMAEHVDEANIQQSPFVGQGFIPLLHVVDISNELLKRFSGSGYVDVKTIRLVNMSKDLGRIIDDIDRQFDRTLAMNTQIVLSGINRNPGLAGNETFRSNLNAFGKFLDSGFFCKNVPRYALLLIQTQVAVGKLMEVGPRKWKSLFKKQNIRPERMEEDIDAFFAENVNAKINLYQPEFKSKLIMTTSQQN